jgi:multiple sugar transport system ATP-binding protein
MAAITINNLCVSFGSLQVLRDLHLAVNQGEFLVLLGPSGCGKSTLLNTIAGLIEPAAGTIEIGGRDVTDVEPKDRGIAMVFQSYALYPKMTVRGNLAFGLKVARLPRREIERRVQEAADFLQITELLDRRPAQLSGGQRQRVAIGRALVRHAGVFLFDEPLSNLDAKLRNELRVEIKRLHRSLGSTMIYVTHDQIEALTLADRIAVMKNGIIQQLGTPRDIYDAPANLFVASFIGSPAMNFVEGEIAVTNGAPRFKNGVFDVPLAAYPFRRVLQDRHRALMGVRPENISVDAREPGTVIAEASVDLVEPMGADTVLWCQCGQHSVSVRVDSGRPVAEGEKLAVSFDPARVSLFDVENGLRL